MTNEKIAAEMRVCADFIGAAAEKHKPSDQMKAIADKMYSLAAMVRGRPTIWKRGPALRPPVHDALCDCTICAAERAEVDAIDEELAGILDPEQSGSGTKH